MTNYPFPPNEPQNVLQAENTFESTQVDEEELLRKQLSYKRTTILLLVVALILLAFIVWEIADLSLGGRP